MNYAYVIPQWFFGFDIGMEILFAIITCLVAVFAFKINKVTKERKIWLLGVAFLLMGLSYIFLGVINYWFAQIASEQFREVSIGEIQTVGIVGVYLYMILFTSGLVTLGYLTAGMKKGKTYYLLFGLSLLVIASSFYKLITFRILAVFLLSFIAYQYFDDYLKNKNKKEFWILLSFTILFLSSVCFIFSPVYYPAYIVGHLFELLAYIIMLVVLIKTVKK